jgi:hypothetical protein
MAGHHQTYVTNLNNLIKDTEFADQSLEAVICEAGCGRCQQGGGFQQRRPGLEPYIFLEQPDPQGWRQTWRQAAGLQV